MSIGENIRLHRKEKGLTQEELGELVGISGVAVMRYEKGQREPKQETLLKISKALGVHLRDLIDQSIWEEFDPTMQGTEHYAMYGSKYSKSLCHAWGSGPIFLLGRYCLGVRPTAPGYTSFQIQPNTQFFKEFKGTVPLPNGDSITVEYRDGRTQAWHRDGTPIAL